MADRRHSPPTGADRSPGPDAIADLVRDLEITVTRKLDGVLHGNHQGLTPGHGTEPGDSRPYHPGDDVRRIDWNVTARTGEPYVRTQIADRDLEAWIVADTSASMRFGTTGTDKAHLALSAAGAIGFLTARNQNRLGAVLVAGDRLRVVPPRGGRDQVRAVLRSIADAAAPDGSGAAELGPAIDRVGAIARRRGFVAVVSDFAGTTWHGPLARLGLRQDLLAVVTTDPREDDVPPIGQVRLVDPASGRSRDVRVTADVQRRYRDLADQRRDERERALRRSGAEVIHLHTDADWLGEIVRHVRRRRVQVTRGQVGARVGAGTAPGTSGPRR